MPSAALADRFGPAGRLAHDLACGARDNQLRPRTPGETVRESLDLPEAASGIQLEHALGLLIDRLLTRRERRGRTLRAVSLSAVLVECGGTWREQVTFREALSDPVRMRLALVPRLALDASARPGAEAHRRAIRAAGRRAAQPAHAAIDARRERLREAIAQARAAAGSDAALRVLEVDPSSRFPERRALLTPFEA